MSDNAAGHLTIAISTPGQRVTFRRVPLNGRRTLPVPAAQAGLTGAITITDESGNRTWRTRRAF